MRLRPTRRGVAVGVIAIAGALNGAFLGSIELVQMGLVGLLLVLLAGVMVVLGTPRRGAGLLITRTVVPEPTNVGSTAQVTIRVTGRTRTARARLGGLRLGEQASPELSGGDMVRAGARRTPGRIEVRYTIRPVTRGRWPLGPLVASREDVFGLVSGSASLGTETQVTVWPAVEDLVVPHGSLMGEPDRVAPGASSAAPDDAALRDYRVGDELRRVHWRSSARRGELVVRSDEHTGRRPVTVWLDLPLDSAGLEWTISLGASIGLAFLEAGHPVRMVTGPGTAARPWTRRGEAARAELLDTMVDLRAPARSTDRLAQALVVARELVEVPGDGSLIAILGTMTGAPLVAAGVIGGEQSSWAIVREPSPGDHPGTAAALLNAGWRVSTVKVGTPLSSAWTALVEAR